MFDRWIEDGLTDALDDEGMGSIVFSPLAQGMLTNNYLKGIPSDSRAANSNSPFLNIENITSELVAKLCALNEIAQQRGQSLAQMAVAWNLRLPQVTSVLVGASRVSQLEDNVAALNNLEFSTEELAAIESVLK